MRRLALTEVGIEAGTDRAQEDAALFGDAENVGRIWLDKAVGVRGKQNFRFLDQGGGSGWKAFPQLVGRETQVARQPLDDQPASTVLIGQSPSFDRGEPTRQDAPLIIRGNRTVLNVALREPADGRGPQA